MPNNAMASHMKTEGFGFFEVTKYPEVVFKSTKMEMFADSVYKLFGHMTIKEITNEIVFDVRFNGFTHHPSKSTPGFTIHGR